MLHYLPYLAVLRVIVGKKTKDVYRRIQSSSFGYANNIDDG
jgi:hypothetical protein